MSCWRSRASRAGSWLLTAVFAGTAAPAAAGPEGSGLAWEVVRHATPRTIRVGQERTAALAVRNVGSSTWSPGEKDHLAYHWRAPDGEMVVLDGERTELPHPVEPGQQVQLQARLLSPPAPGQWLLEWAMVREQVRWYPEPTSGLPTQVRVLALPAATEVGAGAEPSVEPLAWELVRGSAPRFVWMGRETTVPLVIRNTGTVTWSPQQADHLAYHWRSPDGEMVVLDGARTELPHPVEPGQQVQLHARLLSPPEPGQWLLEWAMVREQVRWFPGPSTGRSTEARVRAWQFFPFVQLLFLAATVGALLLVTRWRDGTLSRAACAAGPILWVWAAALVYARTFEELSRVAMEPVIRGMGLSAAAMAALPVAVTPRRFRAYVAGLVTLGLALLALADLVYLRFFGNVIPPEAVFAWRQMGQIQESIASLFLPGDAWLFPGAAAAVAMAFGWPRIARVWEDVRRARLLAMALVAAVLVALLPALRGLRMAWSDDELREQVFDQQQTIVHLGWLGTHAFELARVSHEWLARQPLTEEEHLRIEEFLAERHRWSLAQEERFGEARGMNLIMVQLESLDRWVIDFRLNGQEITPFLNSLQDTGLFFSWVFDQSAQGRSSDGEFAALNAQHPLARGAVVFRRAGNRFVALPGLLQEAGYTTLSAHAFDRGFWNRAVVHPRYGFERSLFRRELGPGESIGWGLADGVFLERMVPRILDLPQPFFSLLITLGLHHPFDEFPERHRVLDVGKWQDTPMGNYLHAMHYLDRSLEEFFQELQRHGLLENTVVALYADHDSGLSIVYDGVKELVHTGLWNVAARHRLRRVPFFVVLPGAGPAGEVPTLGGHIDIAPTLLHLLGVRPPMGLTGTPLVPGRPFPAVTPEGSSVRGNRMLVRTAHLPPSGECFTFPEGFPLPIEECAELDQVAQQELWVSRTAVSRDLVRDFAQSGLP